MALIKCRECGKEISDKATACPGCGAPKRHGMDLLLAIAIIILPIVFCWFTLRPGYSKRARLWSFGWASWALISVIALFPNRLAETRSMQSATPPPSVVSGDANELETRVDGKEKVIPGIMPVDVYLDLESRGFTTTKEFSPCCSWISTDGNAAVRYSAEAIGENPNSVWRINATVVATTDKDVNAIAAPFLGLIASIPYDGSNPAEARQWVERNIGTKGVSQKKFGAVTFLLKQGDLNARLLSLYVE